MADFGEQIYTLEEIESRIAKISARIGEIDKELDILTDHRYQAQTSWVTGKLQFKRHMVIKDPIKSRSLRVERNELVQYLDKLSKARAHAHSGQQDQYPSELQEQLAIEWGAQTYLENMKPRTPQDVRKSWPIAREAVERYLPGLRQKAKKSRIDSVRAKIAAKTRRILELRNSKSR